MLHANTWVADDETIGVPDGEEVRLRALERLYLRREAVDELIRSLEAYQQSARRRKALCVAINAVRKCS